MREEGQIPAVLYGPGSSPVSLAVQKKEFDAVYREAGESSLVTIELEQGSSPVLIREVQLHPLSGDAIHIDFYQPRMDEKLRMNIPVELEGVAPAVKDLEGTLIQNIQEVEVLALPKDLPREIMVSVEGLVSFEDRILVKDLKVGAGVEIVAEGDWIVAQVVPPEKVEEELEKPVEESVDKVEKVETKKKEEVEESQEAPKK